MVGYYCLECNTRFRFLSEKSRYYTCPTCLTVHRKEGLEVVKAFVSEIIQDDCSPIELGTTGALKDKKFSVIGRIRFLFTDAHFNQWTLQYEDGGLGYLGEYAGSFCLFNDHVQDVPVQRFSSLKPGKLYTFNRNQKYALVAILRNEDFQCEGEIPFLPPKKEFVHLEFDGEGTLFALVNIFNNTSMEMFTGNYYDFSDLNFTNLSPLNEWK